MNNVEFAEPPGGLMFPSPNGRRLHAQIFITEREVPEQVLNFLILPWLQNILKQDFFEGFTYTIHAVTEDSRDSKEHPSAKTKIYFHLMTNPRDDRLALERCHNLGGYLRDWLKQNKIAGYKYGVQSLDDENSFYGGPVGLDLYLKIDSFSSLATLAFAREIGSLKDLPNRSLYLLDLLHLTLESACTDFSKTEVVDLLRNWSLHFTNELKGNGPDKGLNDLPDLVQKYHDQISNLILQDQGIAQRKIWLGLLKKAESHFLDQRAAIKDSQGQISERAPYFDWVGRRLIHPNFNRFRFTPLLEIILVAVMAKLLESDSLRWPNK